MGGSCRNNYDSCLTDPFGYALWAFPDKANYGGDFGLARDGHVIKGPYNAQGELWDCSLLDLCNGTFIEDGSYVYAPTSTFPHLVGCWGPGPVTSHRVTSKCSNLTCPGNATSLIGLAIGAIALT